jgi:hypothetical protein
MDVDNDVISVQKADNEFKIIAESVSSLNFKGNARSVVPDTLARYATCSENHCGRQRASRDMWGQSGLYSHMTRSVTGLLVPLPSVLAARQV